MHFRKLLDPTCFSAEDFIDDHFNPIKRTLTIKAVSQAKPPAGGKIKGCFEFTEDPRKAFLGNKEIKKIARMLREAETDRWVGAKLYITSGPKKNPEGGSEMTTGMVVLKAAYPPEHKNHQPSADDDPARAAIIDESNKP
jgi:hypothetical protein